MKIVPPILRNTRLPIFLMAAVLMAGCLLRKPWDPNSGRAACQKVKGKTNIRLRNDTGRQLMGVFISPGDDQIYFGDLKPGQTTCYHPFDKAYRYSAMKMTVGRMGYKSQPVDFVGEKELGPGNFTYVIVWSSGPDIRLVRSK